MNKSTAVIALVASAALFACHSAPKPAAPKPAPAAPATPPPAPPPATPDIAPVEDEVSRIAKMSLEEINRLGLLKEVHFDYDKSDIRAGDRAILNTNADVLKKHYSLKVTVEGHADERGTAEYNLALGEKRARAAYDYLVSLGIAADRLKTVSYGKEVPLCRESNEDCWSRNRRGTFTVTGKTR